MVGDFGNVRDEHRVLGIQKDVEPPNPSFEDEFNNVSMPYYSLMDFQLLSHCPSNHYLEVRIETCFDSLDVGPGETQQSSLVNLPEILMSIFTAFRRMPSFVSGIRLLLSCSLC